MMGHTLRDGLIAWLPGSRAWDQHSRVTHHWEGVPAVGGDSYAIRLVTNLKYGTGVQVTARVKKPFLPFFWICLSFDLSFLFCELALAAHTWRLSRARARGRL